MESWDIYAVGDVTDYFQTVDAGNSTIVAGAGRCSSAAFRNTSAVGNGVTIGVETAVSSGYAAWAHNADAFQVTASFEVQAADGSVLMFARVIADGSVDIWKGPNTTLGTLLGATAAGLISAGTYSHIGLEWNFHASTGYARIYINKAQGGSANFASGNTDTTNIWTSGQWHTLAWLPKGYIDDLYWGDTVGASPWNAFLGDCRVQGQLALTDAVGGVATYRDFTPSAGTDHGALVDENPPDDATTYLSSATIGHRETLFFPAISISTGTVYAVQLMPNAVKTSAGGRQIQNFIRVSSGSTSLAGQIWSPSQTNYKYYPAVMQTNPAAGGAAWTASTVNTGFEGGIEIVA